MIHTTNLAGPRLSSTCSLCSQVIIQKSIFRILHGYSIFLAMSFKVSKAQYTEILNYWPSWIIFSITRIFLTVGILVYSRRISMYAAHQRFYCRRITSYHAGLYIMDFSTMDFISLGSQLIEVLLIISAHSILFRMGFWQRTCISRHWVSIIMARQRMYIYDRSAEMSQSWVSRSVDLGERLIVIHILIGIILIPTFLCSFHPLSKLRGRNFL